VRNPRYSGQRGSARRDMQKSTAPMVRYHHGPVLGSACAVRDYIVVTGETMTIERRPMARMPPITIIADFGTSHWTLG
jgi:hypothetical protein